MGILSVPQRRLMINGTLSQKGLTRSLLCKTQSFHANVRLNPNFEWRRDDLIYAAKCTCNIAMRYGPGETASATAFFVGPNTLLTAGHIYQAPVTEIVAHLPGVRSTERDIDSLFSDSAREGIFRCHVREQVGRPIADILVLECDHTATSWMQVSCKYLSPGLGVDLIGYPGLYGPQYVLKTQGENADSKDAYSEISELLPNCELTVSHGSVMNGFRDAVMVSYRVSTIGGMSGSPVIVDGKAVGIYHLRRWLIHRRARWMRKTIEQQVCDFHR